MFKNVLNCFELVSVSQGRCSVSLTRFHMERDWMLLCVPASGEVTRIAVQAFARRQREDMRGAERCSASQPAPCASCGRQTVPLLRLMRGWGFCTFDVV